jgi:hypothetical protein
MIIVSAGLRKSASTLAFFYAIELIKRSQRRSGQAVLEKYADGKGYRGKLDFKTIILLIYINYRYGDVVLKTHGEPTIYLKLLIQLGLAKVTYNFRDPRDAIISMLDHGKKTRLQFDKRGEKYSSRGFGNIYSVHDAVPRILPDVKAWAAWNNLDETLMIRYEDFTCSKLDYLKKISRHIGCSTTDSELELIIKEFDKEQTSSSSNVANFNKGIAGRFRTEMTSEEVAYCNSIFSEELTKMNYELN